MGIRLIGRATAKTIAKTFVTIDALQEATLEEFIALPDFGQITADTLHKALHSSQGVELFERLRTAGVVLESQETASVDPDFDGKVFVITGSFEQWERKSLTEELEHRGAKVTSSLSKKTDVLIAGEKAGSKLKKGESLGIEIWDETQLMKSLSG